MNTTLYFNETSKVISTASGSWNPPVLTFGETMRVAVLFQQDIDGVTTEVSEAVQYLKAAIGNLDARPTSGAWQLKIGNDAESAANTTPAVPWNVGTLALQNAINALPAIVQEFGSVAVTQSGSSFFFRFGAGAANVALSLVESTLDPACAGMTAAYQVAGQWIQEFRLCQAPVAFTDASARILPDAPSITEIQAGYTDGTYVMDEIQQMTMPPAFEGSYQFRWNDVRSAILSPADDADAIAAALAVFGSTITVTNPRDGIARFDFGGDFAGIPEPLLEIVVVDAPEGDLTFSLVLDTPALAAQLRAQGTLAFPLEVEIGITDSSEPSGLRIEKFRAAVTIQTGIIFDLLAAAQNVDWLRPIPTDYVPFTMDQIFRGQLYYAAPVGDGQAVQFVIDHNLASDAIASVMVRQNIGDGCVLTQGVDYAVTYGGENSLTVTLTAGSTPPAAAGLLVVITAAGMRDSFLQHTHTIDQIVGLSDRLEADELRLTKLESYIPSVVASASTTTTAATFSIPAMSEVLFWQPATLDLTQLPVRPPYLLPAVHTPTTSALPAPLPAPSDALEDTVWASASRQLIPGSKGRIPASYVEEGGFVACDGRMLFPASQAGATVSYYPRSFERRLFEFSINDLQLIAGRTLTLTFGLAVQLLHANSEAQWIVVLEHGVPVDQTDPANEDLNLETIAWNPTPLLRQRIYATPLLITHTFGCQIMRAVAGITANQYRYGAYANADSAPTAPNFVLRARLIEFDTKNNVHDATGWLYYALGDSTTITAAATASIA